MGKVMYCISIFNKSPAAWYDFMHRPGSLAGYNIGGMDNTTGLTPFASKSQARK